MVSAICELIDGFSLKFKFPPMVVTVPKSVTADTVLPVWKYKSKAVYYSNTEAGNDEYVNNIQSMEDYEGIKVKNTIFFKRDKFDLIEEGMFYLSDTPDQPSICWGTEKRCCSWVKLRDKRNGSVRVKCQRFMSNIRYFSSIIL